MEECRARAFKLVKWLPSKTNCTLPSRCVRVCVERLTPRTKPLCASRRRTQNDAIACQLVASIATHRKFVATHTHTHRSGGGGIEPISSRCCCCVHSAHLSARRIVEASACRQLVDVQLAALRFYSQTHLNFKLLLLAGECLRVGGDEGSGEGEADHLLSARVLLATVCARALQDAGALADGATMHTNNDHRVCAHTHTHDNVLISASLLGALRWPAAHLSSCTRRTDA